MAKDSSANLRNAPHANRTTRTNTIMNALKRRAQAVLNDKSIDAKSRAVIRYAVETNDPWLARLVRRADAGEDILDENGFLEGPETDEAGTSSDKIEALARMICRADDEPEMKAAALLVLMTTLENSTHPKVLMNTAKHVAFTQCGELNVYGMVEVLAAAVEGELLGENVVS